jgi:2-dehydropantoate 2-reductase
MATVLRVPIIGVVFKAALVTAGLRYIELVDRFDREIAAAGIITCLFRGCVGDILAAGGESHILRAIAETEEVADSAGHHVSQESHKQTLDLLTVQGSTFTSSLYRDLEQGEPAEAEHILGGLAQKARELSVPTPFLDATLLQLRTHQKARAAAGLG